MQLYSLPLLVQQFMFKYSVVLLVVIFSRFRSTIFKGLHLLRFIDILKQLLVRCMKKKGAYYFIYYPLGLATEVSMYIILGWLQLKIYYVVHIRNIVLVGSVLIPSSVHN